MNLETLESINKLRTIREKKSTKDVQKNADNFFIVVVLVIKFKGLFLCIFCQNWKKVFKNEINQYFLCC